MTGLMVTALILFGKWCVEHHSLYQVLQSACYGWLQSSLRPPQNRADLPVVIVDIRGLDAVVNEVNGKKFTVTPRKQLLDLIVAVAAQKPAVIGIDIDFSPNEFGYLDPKDPQFFRSLMKISTPAMPVFIGIRRSQNKPPEKWLGVAEFAGLGADIMISPNDYRKMVKWVEVLNKSGSGGSSKGESMSAALARNVQKNPSPDNETSGWLLTQYSETELEPGLKAQEFLVDFSAINALNETRLTTVNPATISDLGWTLAGKAVLIGDGQTTDTRDTFPIPDYNHPRGVPGIFKHASAVYTLIKAPLYELTPFGRISVDLLLSLMVLVPVAIIRRKISRLGKTLKIRFSEATAIGLFTALITALALFIGVALVHRERVMWDDFLFVIAALWLHRAIAKGIQNCWSSAQKLPAFFIQIFSQKEGEES
jgi:CHASE2 domain-containing sensor protein